MWYTHFASYGGFFFRKSQSYMKAAFKELGISYVDSIVLINVCEEPGIIQEKIGENLALDNAAVARSLKTMEQDGFVTRVIDVNNQRTKKVSPTQKGIDTKELVDVAMTHWNSKMLAGISESEQDVIISSLRTLRNQTMNIDMDEVLRELIVQWHGAEKEIS